MRTIFHTLAEAGGRADLRVLVVGGFAVSALSRERMTRDIDLMIATHDLCKLRELLQSNGYLEIIANNLVAKFQHPSLLLMPIDVLLVNESTLEKLWRECREVSIEGCLLRVPKPLHMAALKFHAMKENPDRIAKDGADIVMLMQSHPSDVTAHAVEEACRTFGTDELWRRFRAIMPCHDQS